MSLLIQYLVKLSVGLAIVWLFYQFVLRRLTFYNSSRLYLLGYTLLSFFIPFINISPLLEKNYAGANELAQFIPSVHQYTITLEEASHCPVPIWSTSYDKWDWMAFGLMAGAGIFLLRFIIRFISFFRMRRKAKLVSVDGMKLYQVNEHIIPFSFGNAVFINRELHTEAELQEIIRHEFVHVKQRHTLDIIWSEWLCIINWYNPFAWLLKASIRQNLEFIADNNVLENGVNKKQYQYLLLKVIGNNQFSIAPKFNFSSLKKRIAMMNKLKSAKMHLVKFLFILPMLAVILISFRKQIGDKLRQDQQKEPVLTAPVLFTDSVPVVTAPNKKGFIINVIDAKGNCTIVVKDKNGKEVERLLLTKWNENEEYYESKYGKIPPPPPPLPPSAPMPPTPPVAPEPADLPPHVKSIDVNNGKAKIILKDGTKESYDLNLPEQKKIFESKYGTLPAPPAAPEPPTAPTKSLALLKTDGVDKLAALCKDFEITETKAVMHLKDGKTEEYDLTDITSRRQFEKKYGKIINTNANNNVVGLLSPVAVVNSGSGYTVIAPMTPLTPLTAGGTTVLALDQSGDPLIGNEEVLVTITKQTTADQLEAFKKQMKEKGIELKFDNIGYNDGVLVSISGTMKSKEGNSNFAATDFNKLILSMIRNEERTYFKVHVTDNKVVI